MHNIVMIQNKDCFVGTWDLSKGFNVEHRAITRLVEKYRNEFEELGVVATPLQQPSGKKGGRKVEEYVLNEPQTTYLTTLLTNNFEVRSYKLRLTKMFFSQRKLIASLIAQQQNEEWLQKRAEGKISRRFETDTIKEFVSYAKSQGSTNAEKYYVNITQMENKSVFIDFVNQKFPNIRNTVSSHGLHLLESADLIVEKALRDGMTQKLPYKEIYLLAKERVETYTRIIGKTPLQELLESKK